jgi:hypothetical protein
LIAHFNEVILWTTTLPDYHGSLGRSFSEEEVANARDIFAVCSHTPIEKEILLSRISQQKLDPGNLSVEILSDAYDVRGLTSDLISIKIFITNHSKEKFVSLYPYPVNISYHWLNHEGQYIEYGGERTPIRIPLEPNEKQIFILKIKTPCSPGHYVLQITLVQEGNFWIEDYLKNFPLSVNVEIE